MSKKKVRPFNVELVTLKYPYFVSRYTFSARFLVCSRSLSPTAPRVPLIERPTPTVFLCVPLRFHFNLDLFFIRCKFKTCPALLSLSLCLSCYMLWTTAKKPFFEVAAS